MKGVKNALRNRSAGVWSVPTERRLPPCGVQWFWVFEKRGKRGGVLIDCSGILDNLYFNRSKPKVMNHFQI